MSIFGKDCPRCGETNAAYAVSCRCGFAFNSVDHVEEEESDISVTIEEEELYLEYLTARAQQAAETAKNAASAAAAQPASKVAASQAQQAQVVADQAKTELEQQRARMKVTIHGLADDRPGAPEQRAAQPEQPASAALGRPQSPAFSTTPPSAPAKPVTAPPVGERKQPATPAPKPAVAPLGVERKEPAPATVRSSGPAATDSKPIPPATVKSSGPAATDSKPMPPAGAKTPQDLNRYVPGADNARTTMTGDSASQTTDHPARSQTKIPTGPADARPETKVQASALSTTNKVVSPAVKTSATQAVPTKPEHVPTSKQPHLGSASSTARPAPTGHGNVGAGPQAPRAAETPDKPATQGDAVAAKAAAAAARAKQLAEALKAAQAERAAKAKTSAATPSPDSKGQEEPTASGVSSAAKAPTAVQTPRAAAATSRAAATAANPANGQQQKLNGHDKPYADINAIPIPGTGPGEITLESDEAVSKQAASAPETVAEQPGAGTPSSSGRPTQKTNGTPRPMVNSEKAPPAKPAPGVTVTVTPGADPQDELEAALKALSVRTPAPPESGPDKTPADTKDAAVSPEIGDNSAPAAAPTPASDGLPSLEPVTPANQKDCPNCTALLPMDAKRCRCGFRFPEIEETMPGLSLSDSDFAALDGDSPSDGITHLS